MPIRSSITNRFGESYRELISNIPFGCLTPWNLRPREIYPGEFDFFFEEAKRSGGPVAEFATGPARTLIALTSMGLDVDLFGVDSSGYALKIAKLAIQRLPQDQQKRIHLIRGDMRRTCLAAKFPLVIIAYNSFWFNFWVAAMKKFLYIPNNSYNSRKYKYIFVQAEYCLRSVLESLLPGGRFIIDGIYKTGGFDFGEDQVDVWLEFMARVYRFRFEVVSPYEGPNYHDQVLIGNKT